MADPRAVGTQFVRGVAMGAADVVPGVSGGTVALLLGVYEQLVATIRDGSIALDADGLVGHLRQTVVNQILIDQPTYPGCIAALGFGADS